MTYRLRNIGIAIALALVAGLLTIFYVTNYKRTVRDAESNVTVYVAAKDIPAGMSGSEAAAEGFLTKQEVVKRNVTPGAISSPGQIEESVAADTIYAGEQVTTRRFTSQAEKGVLAQIAGNERAFQLPGERHQLLVGTLKEGDRVDVVGTWKVPESVNRHFSRVFLRDLLVLEPASVGGEDAETNAAGTEFSVMLALTDAEAQKLFWVAQNGAWSLQLRPANDPADSPESAETAETLLLDGVTTDQLKELAAAGARIPNGKE